MACSDPSSNGCIIYSIGAIEGTTCDNHKVASYGISTWIIKLIVM